MSDAPIVCDHCMAPGIVVPVGDHLLCDACARAAVIGVRAVSSPIASMHDARMLWREELALAGATAAEIVTFDALTHIELARLIGLAIRIGTEWGDQEGISGHRMDALADAVIAASDNAPAPRKTLTPEARARLDAQLAEVVARFKAGT